MSDKKRIITFFVFVGLFSLSFAIGAETKVLEDEANLFLEEFESLVENIDAIGIFFHNLAIALPMFLPGFGIGWGFFAAWQTGVAFAAFETLNPELIRLPPLTVLYLAPFGLMELAAYSIAMSRSFIIIHRVIKKLPLFSNFKWIIVEVGIVIGLLFAGAVIEDYMIKNRDTSITSKIEQNKFFFQNNVYFVLFFDHTTKYTNIDLQIFYLLPTFST